MAADKVFVNGRIYTLDAAGSQAEALAVSGERISAVGTTEQIKSLAGQGTQEIDLGGQTVIPGCIDSHCHLMMHGVACTRSASLSDCRSIAELQNRLRDHWAKNPDAEWIIGERFDQEMFSDGRWVTREDLDKVSKDVPVLAARLCYHAIVANSAALLPVKDRLTKEQWETGRLTEDDCGLVWGQVPDCTDEELENAALHALTEARNAGLTSVHSQIDDDAELAVVRRLHDQGRLPLRVRFQWPFHLMDRIISEGMKTGSGDDYLRVGSIKIFMDGSMGARTCAMCEEFADDPGNCGNLFRTDGELAEMLVAIQRNECQAAIHAIGDLAIVHAVSGIEIAMPKGNEGNRLRHRLEHVAQMSPKIMDDMARLNVLASVQPQFVITDFWTADRVGPARYRCVYPFKSMLQSGIKFGMGSDCPVERLDAMELLHRAVNREPGSLNECLTVDETLRGYTNGSAYIGFEEHDKGSLEVGKLADFVVLSEDPYATEPQELGRIRPLNTVLGGRMQ
jgi:predicted amidohydrolase YtcJ